MNTRVFTLLVVLLSFVTVATAQTPAPPEVHVKLSLAENKTVYRIGIYAVVNGKSWKLLPERVRDLQTSCMTQLCKQSNLMRQ